MERKAKFVEGEYYHLFSRGVEKRKIFQNTKDYERFMSLLYIVNQQKYFHLANFVNNRNKKLSDLFNVDRSDSLVSILSYSLVPNHFHFLVYEKTDGGISKFMAKLLTAYSMYFNLKYERSGPLFVRPFRSVHVESDEYFQHLFSYIHLNPLELFDPNWKERGLKNPGIAEQTLKNYHYSSYQDFLKPRSNESKIIDWNALPPFISRTPLDINLYLEWYLSKV